MRIFQKLAGFLLTTSGLGGAVFTLLALADSQQAQLANDANPFGSPPSTGQLLVHLAICLIVLGAGVWLLLVRSNRPR